MENFVDIEVLFRLVMVTWEI